MFVRMPVLVEHHDSGVAVAQLLDASSHQAAGVSAEQAMRLLKKQLVREIRKHRITDLSSWKDAVLTQKNFPVQPAVVRRDRRYPAGPKVSLPVRYVELLDHRDQLYLMLPDFGEILYVAERGLLKTVLSESVRAATATLSPAQLHRIWPCDNNELRWLRLKLAEPGGLRPGRETKVLEAVAEPMTGRRNLTVAPGSRDTVLRLITESIASGGCILSGETGVGKSTLVAVCAREKELARRKARKAERSSGQSTNRPSGPIFWQTNGGRLIAGMRYLGQWQQRLETVVAELTNIGGVLVVENLLDLVSVGGSQPSDSLAAFLLPYLRSGSLRMVAEATPTELDACRRLLPGLVDALPIIDVPPLSTAHEVELLQMTLQRQLQSTDVEVAADLPACLSRLCRQFQSHAAPPGPAMRIVEEVIGKRRTADNQNQWTIPWILELFSKRTGLPLVLIDDAQTLQRQRVVSSLASDVLGQPQACQDVASLVTRIKSAVQDPGRPFGSCLFCGPTGVGKTQMAKSLAKYLFGSSEERLPLVRLDMSEFTGPTAGYRFLNATDRNPAPWIQKIRTRPLSVLLLDEIEKASSEVFDILLSVLDEGRLTDQLGRVTSFRNTVILMTSNIGARTSTTAGFAEDQSIDYIGEVRKAFKPEFFNRVDQIIAFRPLSTDMVRDITEKELRELQFREGLQRYGHRLSWSTELVEHLARIGVRKQLGARPLQQAIEMEVVAPLSKWLVESPANHDAIALHLHWDDEKQQLTVSASE